MPKRGEELLNELRRGNFKDVQLDQWFVDNQFEYIFATLEGCEFKKDYALLHFISMYAQYMLVHPNGKAWNEDILRKMIINSGSYPGNISLMTHEELIDCWNEKIVKICEWILEKVIIIGSKNQEYYEPILEQLSTNANDNVRLYCCANLYYEPFLNDASPRVAKVAAIRQQFDQKWDSLYNDDVTKQRIQFLTAALEKDVIQCWNGNTHYDEDDKVFAIFRSMLFNGEVWQAGFDYDIFSTIQDKRILADKINDLIVDREVTFRDGMLPSCFDDGRTGAALKKENKKN